MTGVLAGFAIVGIVIVGSVAGQLQIGDPTAAQALKGVSASARTSSA